MHGRVVVRFGIAARALLLAGARLAALSLAAVGPASAERAPVLPQIDLPHPYYYREMFLPQLTSGPSALAWSPDSTEIVYAMAGSLWRQRTDGGPAQQLTAPAQAYDYQPDWSPDGRWVIYSSYAHDAVELWALDLANGGTHALTSNGGVNVEPRFSPDGRRIVFTSTDYHKRFHVFTADFDDGQLRRIERLTGEHASELPRYYYSAYDHEINPVWMRDGREIVYVSNRGHLYGTGGFWRLAVPADAPPRAGEPLPDSNAREFHYEETNWKARPDVSPDGSRLVYSSYLGQSWNTLWLMPAAGGDALPLAYGDFDMTYPRWSPDGTRIAFISNRDGNLGIGVIHVPGGLIETLPIGERHYLKPMGRLEVDLEDGRGGLAAARVSVTDANGLAHAPADAWIQADDGFDRSHRPFEQHYFHAAGRVMVDVPPGEATVTVVHGLERRLAPLRVTVLPGGTARLAVDLSAGTFTLPAAGHWVSADVHVHMNYGGTYRNTPAHLVTQAQAENLGLVHALIVNKEERVPDIAYSGRQRDPASVPDAIVVHGQEYHTSYWGHLGLLDIGGGIILPGYAGYPHTAASSLYPMNADIADLGHERGALVGYVHPFDELPEPIAKPKEPLTDELPVDVALGKVDYIEIVGFSDHRSTASVWYRLLNLGYRIPAAGGTDAMANFASLRGPVGMNRVYVRVPDGPVRVEDWLLGLKEGHSVATNGPLLGFTLGAQAPGDTLELAHGESGVAFSVRLRSIVAVDHLELICNGHIVRSFIARAPLEQGDFSGRIPLEHSGWCLARASTDGARDAVLDNYAYATTSPVYVEIAGERARSSEDARYFVAWMDRLTESVSSYPDFNSPAEKRAVLERIARARAIFTAMQ